MEERLANLERRLARGQRQVRLLSALAILMLAAVAAGYALRPTALSAKPGDDKPGLVVKAPFEVVGADGNRLLAIEEKREGGAVVRLYRPGGKIYSMFDCSPAGGSLALFTPEEKLVVVLDSLVDGGSITQYNADGREGLLLSTTSHGGAKLKISEPGGNVLFAKP